MRRILLILLCMVSYSAYAQHTVIVNPDGSHSVAIHSGNSTTIVNPDGTHTVVINNGNSAAKDNPKWKKWWTRKSKTKKKGSSVNDQPAN